MEYRPWNGWGPLRVNLFAIAGLILLGISACGGGGDEISVEAPVFDGPVATTSTPLARVRAPLALRYDATVISLPGERVSVGRKSINAAGNLTGTYFTHDGKARGFFYDGRLLDIGTLGGLQTRPTAINNAGQVVGSSETTYRVPYTNSIYNTMFDYQSEAFLWSKGQGMQAIAPVPDDRFRGYADSSSNATDINNAGEVIGRKRTIVGDYHPPFLWTRNNRLRDAANVLEEWDYVSGLSESGYFVGNGMPLGPDPGFPNRLSTRNIFYNLRTNTALPLLNPNNAPNPDQFLIDFTAGDINRAGTVAGSRSEFNRQTGSRTVLALIVRPLQNHTEERLGETIGANVQSHAIDINDAEEAVVVTGTPESPSRKGYFWSKARGLVDLGAFNGNFIEPVALNGDGIIVGRSRLPNGSFAAFAWSERSGLVRLDSRIRNMNPRRPLREAVAITDTGLILAKTDRELVVLRPVPPPPPPPGRR